jgi:hypothetical protein
LGAVTSEVFNFLNLRLLTEIHHARDILFGNIGSCHFELKRAKNRYDDEKEIPVALKGKPFPTSWTFSNPKNVPTGFGKKRNITPLSAL